MSPHPRPVDRLPAPPLAVDPRPAFGRAIERPPAEAPRRSHRRRAWRVAKLGGTTMSSAVALEQAAGRLIEIAAERPLAVVVSALAGVTDALCDALERPELFDAMELLRRHESYLEVLLGRSDRTASERFQAMLAAAPSPAMNLADSGRARWLAVGEQLSAELLRAICRERAGGRFDVSTLDPGGFIRVDGDFLDGDPVVAAPSRHDAWQASAGLFIVPGFYGRDVDGRVRLLGRGGSDTAATCLGAALGADRVEIWTDVDGVFPRDPRRHPGQHAYEHLSYEHAERLAAGGAKVLHAKSIAPARRAGVPVVVRNSFRPEVAGTWIGSQSHGSAGESPDGSPFDPAADDPGDDPRDDPRDESSWLRASLLRLCRVESTTGREYHLLPPLVSILESIGADVSTEAVDGARVNVLATFCPPEQVRVLFTTHLDTVPPFVPPRLFEHGLEGRGACDAKGQIVAQLGAVRRLLEGGERRVAWLGVVGEEVDGCGARALTAETTHESSLASRLSQLHAVVNGEPTENRLPAGQKGFLHLRLRCRGRRAHGGDADAARSESAIWRLHDWLASLRSLARTDALFGQEVLNVGLVRGGDAANVVAGSAEAQVVVRTVPGSTFLDECRRLAPSSGELEVLVDEEPLRFSLDGLDLRELDSPELHAPAVGFGSDAPHLAPLVAPGGRLLMFGPGSIALAHTDHESLRWSELEVGVDTLVAISRRLLRECGS